MIAALERGFFSRWRTTKKGRLPQKERGEIFGRVESVLGANRVIVRSIEGKIRMARILGKMSKRFGYGSET
jgi:translation initiation factor 1A